MKNSITWVKPLHDYHELNPELFTPFCTVLINQMAIDPDVPESGIPLPLTAAIYNAAISEVYNDILARQNSRSIALTSDETAKMNTLLIYTDILVGYIEITANQKYSGKVVEITTIFARFGLKANEHGKVSKHIFKVLHTASCSATLECPAFGEGANYHWRFSTDNKNWTQVKSTHKSMVTITKLPKDVRVYFQFDVSQPVGRGAYPEVSALVDDFSWSDSISELIPA